MAAAPVHIHARAQVASRRIVAVDLSGSFDYLVCSGGFVGLWLVWAAGRASDQHLLVFGFRFIGDSGERGLSDFSGVRKYYIFDFCLGDLEEKKKFDLRIFFRNSSIGRQLS